MVHPRLRPTRRAVLASAAAPWLAGCSTPAPLPAEPPPLPREFRAAWVATVQHIDWPSRAGLSTAEQRAELHRIVDTAAAIGLNALVLQVRPSADAIYPSSLEPWSEYLTGASGRAPDPPWDPLAEWVDAAHRRGLELHAWFNPYRARHPSAVSEPADSHVAKAEPAIVRPYGEWLWMDPGEPRAAERMLAVVLDVVQRYDIDGVHLDDYFYPYPVNDAGGRELPFPDQPSWQRYRDGGGRLALADWRRDNVDRLIETLYRAVHAAKPWLRVGISPFGLPRPDLRPEGITGFSQFDTLYADVERWLHAGWLDYLAPQLYWPIAQRAQAFAVLLDAWLAQNRQQRHVWPGLFTSRIGAAERAYAASEVLAQIDAVRARPAAGGHLHFSMAALLQDRDGIAARLRAGPYASPALPPATPWLDEPAPQAPAIEVRWRAGGGHVLHAAQPAAGPPLRETVAWLRRDGTWQLRRLAPGDALPLERATDAALIAGIGRTGLASRWQRLQRSWRGWQHVAEAAP